MILTIVGCDNHSESGNSDVMNTTKSEESKYVADMRSTTVSSSKDSMFVYMQVNTMIGVMLRDDISLYSIVSQNMCTIIRTHKTYFAPFL